MRIKMAASLRTLLCLRELFKVNSLQLTWCRNLALTKRLQQEAVTTETDEGNDSSSMDTNTRKVVDVDTSIRYLDSSAFVKGYGDKPVWYYYRRNHKGQFPPKTRKTCVRNGKISTGSPCPICRDEYLVLDSKNTKLLEQFVSPYSGEIFESRKTGLCQKQQTKLVLEVMRAQNEGRIEKPLPFRFYDYEEYTS